MARSKKTMDSRLRRVTHGPMDVLWDSDGQDLSVTRGRSLDADAIKGLLRQGVRRFVVVDFVSDLRWIEGTACLDFWKNEARDHLCVKERPYREDYPGEYCYHASEWIDASGTATIILFEMEH